MNYVENVRQELLKHIDDYDQWGPDGDRLLDFYALLTITKGQQTTMKDIHDAWSLWTNPTGPEHPSLIPFEELSMDVAEYDRPYMAAVHETAAALRKEREYLTTAPRYFNRKTGELE